MPVRRLFAPALAIAMLTGCPGVINVVVPPTAGEKSPAPKDTKATPKPTGTAKPSDDGCAPRKAAPGPSKLGAFAGTTLPAEMAALASEAAVTAAIAKLKADADAWDCFQRTYPAATVAFLGEPSPGPTAGTSMPTTMPAPPSEALPDRALAAECVATSPAAPPTTFTAKHGRYNGQLGPNGWDNLADERAVTDAIRMFQAAARGGGLTEVQVWACTNKFYLGMLTVYRSIQEEPGAVPSPTMAPTCAADAPAAPPSRGLAKHGAYNAQSLPNGWDNLADEASVTEAIRKVEDGAGWACFQKFHPGASTVYKTKK